MKKKFKLSYWWYAGIVLLLDMLVEAAKELPYDREEWIYKTMLVWLFSLLIFEGAKLIISDVLNKQIKIYETFWRFHLSTINAVEVYCNDMTIYDKKQRAIMREYEEVRFYAQLLDSGNEYSILIYVLDEDGNEIFKPVKTNDWNKFNTHYDPA